MDALLSIVILARENSSLLFREALQSALGQSHTNREILVVNANAPESPYTAGLLEDLSAYPELDLIHAGGVGPSLCRNLALRRVRGAYVAFMEGSDVWSPRKAAEQIAAMGPDAAASCANGIALYSGAREVRAGLLFEPPEAISPTWLMESRVAAGSQALYRTAALRGIGGFDERLRLYADMDALLRLSREHRIALVPQALFQTRAAEDGPELLEDLQRLYRNNRDLFLVNRRLASAHCLLLSRHARANRLWLHAGLYQVLAFLKSPLLRSAGMATGALLWAGRALKQGILSGAALLMTAGLLLRVVRGGRVVAPSMDPRPAPEPPTPPTAKRFAALPAYRFAGRRIRRARVPEGVVALRRGFFLGCAALESVELPSSLERIEPRAFQGCRRLVEIRFGEGCELVEIGAYAFAGCASLRTLLVPGNLSRLGTGAFFGCASLQRLDFLPVGGRVAGPEFPALLRQVPRLCFAGCASLTEARFEKGSLLESMGPAAFFGCASLERVSAQCVLNAIGAYAFSGCERLRALDIPTINHVQRMGRGAFARCRSLEALHVPFPLTRIRTRSYYGCAALRYVSIPPNVTYVCREAFAKCGALEAVVLMNAKTLAAPSAFPPGVQVHVLDEDELA